MSRFGAVSPFFRKSAASFGLRFGGLALQFGGSILIARALGVDGFGVYSYAFVIVGLLATAQGCGFGFLAIRELPQYLVAGQHGLIRGYLLAWLVVLLISATLVTLALLVVLAAGLISLQIAWPLIVAAAMVHSLVLGLSAVLNALQRVITSQFIETILRQGVFLAVLLALLTSGSALSPAGVFTLSLGVSGIILLLMLWYVRRSLLAEIGAPETPVFAWRRWIVAGMPLMAIGIMHLLQTSLDVLMLGILTDHGDIGRYRAAARGVDIIIIANGIALQLLEPALARAIGQKDIVMAQRLISSSVLVSVGLGAGVGIPLGIGATFYLGLFGPDFVAAALVIQILVIGYMLAFLCGPVTVILVMQGHERLVMWTALAVLVINACLNIFLIPAYGIIGAAVATAISVLLFKAGLLIAVRCLTPFDPTPWTPLIQYFASYRR
jgi:O-antigen/teichoic acid export membrane protein